MPPYEAKCNTITQQELVCSFLFCGTVRCASSTQNQLINKANTLEYFTVFSITSTALILEWLYRVEFELWYKHIWLKWHLPLNIPWIHVCMQVGSISMPRHICEVKCCVLFNFNTYGLIVEPSKKFVVCTWDRNL